MYDQFGLFRVILCGFVVGYLRLDKDGIYGCFVYFMSWTIELLCTLRD